MVRITVLLGFIILLCLASNVSAADRDWTNAGGDRLWSNSANWTTVTVPTSGDKAAIRNQAILGPIIDSDTAAVADVIVLGDWGSTADTIDMTGGSLTTSNWFILGYYLQNNGTFTMSAGTVNIGTYLWVGNGGTGTVNISGGTLIVSGILSIAQQAGSTGRVNLDGGTISTHALNISGTGKMNITSGTLIVDGNQVPAIRGYEASYLMTAFNGAGKLVYEYNIANAGKTTVTAVAAPVVSWDNGGSNNLWSDAANWNPDGLPDLTNVISISTSGASPVINSPTAAAGFQIRVGASGSSANLTMNGGSLDVAEWLMIGVEAASRQGSFTMNGGTVNLGRFNSSGGHLWIGFTASGTFTMNGGTINAPGRFGLGFSGGSAAVHLNGGTIAAGYFSMTPSCLLDITGGTLIIDGDQTMLISGYKTSGLITAFGGAGEITCQYNVVNPGKTTVTARGPIAGDIDKDWDVDIDDFILFASEWLNADPESTANFDGQGSVDFKDFAILGANWMQGILTNWHVAATQYPTDDLIVTPYRAADFGIVGDGVTDVTTAIQSALNSVSNLGGGTLFLPAGNYKISGNLTIPTAVTLRGEWQKPEIGSPITGTILQAYAGRGDENAAPFIELSSCSGVKGLAIWYPEQVGGDIRPYPPTFKRGSGINHTIENITFVNAYFGFTTYNASITACPFVRNIYGTPLKTGIEFDCLADIGRLETVHFSPDYWRYSGLLNAPTANEHAQWIHDNGTGVIMRRIDWSYSAYVTVEGYNIGLAVRPSLYDGITSNGQCYAYTLVNCKTGIYVEGSSYAGLLLTRLNIQQAQVGVHLGSEAQPTQLHTCSIDASDEAVLNDGSSAVMMQNCDFQRGGVSTSGGYLTIVNCDFGSTSTSHIELGSGVHGASILGNRFVGGPEIVNNTTYPVYIDHTPLAVAALPAYDYKKPERDFKPAKSSIFVVTKHPYNAKADGTTDDTIAFQAALASAAANGGGIVFVPGGDYRLNGTLTIPTGVELRGVFDVPHGTLGRGSVLNIYAGRNQENGTAFIQLETGAGIRGLTFHYPEQIYNAGDTVNYGMAAYPFMIRGLGSDVYVINVAATIPYQLLDLATYRCDNHYIDYLWSTALKTGIKVGGGSVGGQIHNCQLNPSSYTHASAYYASIPPNAADGIHQYLWNTARPYVFGNMSGEVLHQNFVFGALYGIHLIEEGGAGPSGYSLGMGADQATRSLQVDAVGSAGLDMINTQLVTVDSVKGRYIETASSFTGTCRLFSTACWGIADHSVVANGGTLEMQLFHNVRAGAVAYDVRGKGNLICIGGDVLNYVDSLLLIEPGAAANFTANVLNTSESQMPVNSGNVTAVGNLRTQ